MEKQKLISRLLKREKVKPQDDVMADDFVEMSTEEASAHDVEDIFAARDFAAEQFAGDVNSNRQPLETEPLKTGVEENSMKSVSEAEAADAAKEDAEMSEKESVTDLSEMGDEMDDTGAAKTRKSGAFMEKVWNVGALAVEGADKGADLIGTGLCKGADKFMDGCGSIVVFIDFFLDTINWYISKFIVRVGRKMHRFRVEIMQHSREIVKHGLIAFVLVVLTIAVYASAIDYKYYYNGRALGYVKEQNDVIQVLDIISDELSKEYGTDISINVENNISFEKVLTFGKTTDDNDTVLKRFTYMGDIQASAYSIMLDGKRVATLETEEIATRILDTIKNDYLATAENVEYESVSFADDIKIEKYETVVGALTSEESALNALRQQKEQEVIYTVQAGDSFYYICDKMDVTMAELKALNPWVNEKTVLHVGDSIILSKAVPRLTVRTVEKTYIYDSVPFEVEYVDSSAYYQGEQFTSRAGVNGTAQIYTRLTKDNGVVVKREDISREIVVQPVKKIITRGTKPIPPRIGSGYFIMPVQGRISSRFGPRWGGFHRGIDIPCKYGTSVVASDGGKVTYAGWKGSYGYAVIIDHGGNRATLYGHLSSISVRVGENVFQGQRIGGAGSTGNSTGVHVHFEVHINGKQVNPLNYL